MFTQRILAHLRLCIFNKLATVLMHGLTSGWVCTFEYCKPRARPFCQLICMYVLILCVAICHSFILIGRVCRPC